jgi:hypothetical protein
MLSAPYPPRLLPTIAETPNKRSRPLTPAPEAREVAEQRAYVGEHHEPAHHPERGEAQGHDHGGLAQSVHPFAEAHDRRALDDRQQCPDTEEREQP